MAGVQGSRGLVEVVKQPLNNRCCTTCAYGMSGIGNQVVVLPGDMPGMSWKLKLSVVLHP